MIDDWHDYLRLFVLALDLACVVVLLNRYRLHAKHWNQKTTDYWYSLLMWCSAGAVLVGQGIALDYVFGPSLVCATAASLVTGKGIWQKGGWGEPDA